MKKTSATLALMLTGCSFPHAGLRDGQILTLSTSGTYGVDQPIHIHAVAEFTGAMEKTFLSVRVVSTPSNRITVSALGTPAGPLLGLGIFPADKTTLHRVNLEATVTLDRTGTFTIEGLSARAGTVTATESLVVY